MNQSERIIIHKMGVHTQLSIYFLSEFKIFS